MRKLIIVLLAVVAAFTYAAARPDTARGQDTAAVAVNTKDGSSVFRLAFHIQRVAGDVVDNSNAAVSFSSCESCKTVAISIQVVLVIGDPSVVTPTNLALAFNLECNLCESLASAYQWVLSTGGPVHFTPEGQREINEIMKELRELSKSGLPIEEIQARVEVLMRRLARVLEEELVAAGKAAQSQGQVGGEPQTTTETAPITTTTTTTTTTEAPPPEETTDTTITEPLTTTSP